MYLTQLKPVLFAVISTTSYYQFLGSTPFEIAHGIYSKQINYAHAKLQVYLKSIWHVWQRVHSEEAHRVSSPVIEQGLANDSSASTAYIY